MSLSTELEETVTNAWALLHSTASGCISIALWESLRLLDLGSAGLLGVYGVTAVVIVQAVRMHRKATIRVGPGRNQGDDSAAPPAATKEEQAKA